MCGRARCTLNPRQVAKACGLADGSGDALSIPTLEMDRYRPSYNVSPGAYLPVVAARKERKGSGQGREAPVIHCMKWGLVPSFTKKTEKPDHFKMVSDCLTLSLCCFPPFCVLGLERLTVVYFLEAGTSIRSLPRGSQRENWG
ncbi:hypothetical protein COCNU_scaffold001996G000010 [Cocos nucifera]|nr:hypothetical protein [Cocos nucifera]